MATKPDKSGTSKTGALLKVLRSKNGASLAQLVSLSGWQPHSVRGFLAGKVKKHMGLGVDSYRSASGERRYRVKVNS